MKIHNVILWINQHLPMEVMSPIIDRIGFASIATVAGVKTAVESGAAPSVNDVGSIVWFSLIVSMIGGLTFIVKNIVETYINIVKRKEEKESELKEKD